MGILNIVRRVWRGLSLRPVWTHDGTGFSSKRCACLAGYHPRESVTWAWAIYWTKRRHFQRPSFRRYGQGSGTLCLGAVPFLGQLDFLWHRPLAAEAV